MTKQYGPVVPLSEEIHALKYRGVGEAFKEGSTRLADGLKDDVEHFEIIREIILDMRFLAAGRVQTAIGSPRATTPYNCFVDGGIHDSLAGIMKSVTEASRTMQMGGGIGFDFSTLRFNGDLIVSIDSRSSGPVSFMGIYDALCKTIASAGHRRGAMMAVLRVDHPDIEEFVRCKSVPGVLTQFNISVGITDEFMNAVLLNRMFALKFEGKVIKMIDAAKLWDEIMRQTWDWAEPGVLFMDTINKMNNLQYCETIAATNPCAEQPLPPYGACLLGSWNLVKYIKTDIEQEYYFDYAQFIKDIPPVVRMMDNIVDRALYPLPEQEAEAKGKRRMGLGVTGVANALEALGMTYGSQDALKWIYKILEIMANETYRASALLAKEKGAFPLYAEAYLDSKFLQRLDDDVFDLIKKHGIRNSHLLSIAPTGTISLTADNVSSGIEPVFSASYDRTIKTFDGERVERVEDYGVRVFGNKPKTADELSPDEHLGMLLTANYWMDSAVSKTCNIGADVTFEEFKDVYMKAWKGGAKGCTTFRASGKRYGILNATQEDPVELDDDVQATEFDEGGACFVDPSSGQRSCE